MYFAALSVSSPYVVLYYKEFGLSGSQIGLLLGLGPIISLVAAPVWTGLADVRHHHKAITTLTLLLSTGLMATLPFVKTFGLLVLVISGFSFFIAPIIPLVDNATISMLGDQRDRYGQIRMWGTIGWGLTAPIAGMVLQAFGLRWMFWIYCGLMLLSVIPTRKLTFTKNTEVTPFWNGLTSVITNRRWLLFLGMVFIAGIGLSSHGNYLAVLMEQKGGDKSLMGIALLMSTICEIPVMFYSNVILRKLKSRGLLIMAVTFAGLRCLLYASAGSSTALLMIQLLHGFTFPALWVAGITYVAENAPPGMGATIQAVFGGALMGFGMAAGGVLGGSLIDLIGLQGMFAVFGLIVFIGLGTFLVFDRPPIRTVQITDQP